MAENKKIVFLIEKQVPARIGNESPVIHSNLFEVLVCSGERYGKQKGFSLLSGLYNVKLYKKYKFETKIIAPVNSVISALPWRKS